jgi:hypothetical protein
MRALVGVAAAVTVACALAGCGAGAEPGAPAGAMTSTGAPPGSSSTNERVLSAGDSARLVAWFRRFRSCLGEHGIETEQIVLARRELSLRTRTRVGASTLVGRSLPCGEALGDPPTNSSLQIRPGEDRVVLYLPKQCLLDPKVTRQAA